MTTEYEFVNVDTYMATEVFAENLRAANPAKACVSSDDKTAAADAAAARFFYVPWQYLNASQGAREYFYSTGWLAFEAKAAPDPAAGEEDGEPSGNVKPPLRRSQRIPAYPGVQYMLIPGVNDIQVAQSGSAANANDIEVVSPPSGVNPFTVAIDWYWGENRIGVTDFLKPGVTALFQAGGKRLFMPLSPAQRKARYAPAELTGVTPYVTPANALKVMIVFQKQDEKRFVYVFSPQSAS
ncbi:MAG TPA: hypothetical protein DEP05_04375 [Betaproteobacteria bacterium]|nr:hypothetical protein [Betaproteobacteria bacterium]